jgi:hypothetical protein
VKRRVIRNEVTEGDGPAASLNAAVVVSSGRGSSSTWVRSRQRIVQQSGKTRVTTERDVETESEGRG